MKPTLARSPFAAALLAAATLAIPACSSSGPATNVTLANDYCDSYSGYASRCGLTDACTTALVSACNTSSAIYTTDAAQVLSACLSDAACTDGGAPVNTGPCFQEGLVKLAPSAAQSKLAQEFCVACATPLYNQTTATCSSTIFESGDGIDWKLYSDSAITTADTNCSPPLAAGASADVCNTFIGCVDTTISALAPPPAACTGADGG